MQELLEKGSSGFIIESNQTIMDVVVLARHGEFYVLRLPTGGAIKLRRSRIFSTKEEAEQMFPKRTEILRTFNSPYEYGH